MSRNADADALAGTLLVSVGLLVRRVRQLHTSGDLTLAENSALTRLDRFGPSTSSALAKHEQISPQSMGATLSALEDRGLVVRHPDPDDGRRFVLSLTDAGATLVQGKRTERTERLAHALTSEFTTSELRQLMAAVPLIERLARSF